MKNNKLLSVLLVVLILTIISVPILSENSAPKVMVNGTILGTDAVLINDRTFVPLRGVFESVGAEVAWNDTTNTAEINMPLESRDQIIPEVIAKVSPCVVGIIGKFKANTDATYQDKFYGGIAHGSGVIIKSGGVILTNAHVVKDLETIYVVLSDGSSNEARIKCIDEDIDLATIKINKLGLPVATFAKSEDIVAGKTVVAIGTPVSFSLRNSATCGIISGVNRALNGDYKLIQTDAAINPGNSGGPLINLKGEVVGINSSKYMSVGIEGMGFSIPVDTIQYALSHFEKYGHIRRPSLGATFEESAAAMIGLPYNGGLIIKSLNSSSILSPLGVNVGDKITQFGDFKINSMVDLCETYKSYLPNDVLPITIMKKSGEEIKIVVTLGEN